MVAPLAPVTTRLLSVRSTEPPSLLTRSTVQKWMVSCGSPAALPVMMIWRSEVFVPWSTCEPRPMLQLSMPGREARRRTAITLSGAEAKYSRV